MDFYVNLYEVLNYCFFFKIEGIISQLETLLSIVAISLRCEMGNLVPTAQLRLEAKHIATPLNPNYHFIQEKL